MRRTKIICTIGPASDSPEMLEKLVRAGMNIARINFSHGEPEEKLRIIKNIVELNKTLPVPVGILLDTRGPAIRLGDFRQVVTLLDGSEVTLTSRDVMCDEKIISVSYKKLASSIKPGGLIYIADGTIELKVRKINGPDVLCEVLIGGEVNTRKNVTLPGAEIDLPAISEKDIADIEIGTKSKVDFVAQSFVRVAQDVIDMKRLLRKNNCNAFVIAKIECAQGLYNIDEILGVSDGIMVARGDLGTQIPIEKVPNIQKQLIKKCNNLGKPVIVATQMLESMIKSPKPTRAEATDVANAILDGADAIMLSGETASGKHPVRCVVTMNLIAKETEQHQKFHAIKLPREGVMVEDAIAKSVCEVAQALNAAAIITCTSSGYTARIISKYRPMKPIIAVTPSSGELSKLNLFWGVLPVLMPTPKNSDELLKNSMQIVKKLGLVKRGEQVVITASIPFGIPGKPNFMKVDVVE